MAYEVWSSSQPDVPYDAQCGVTYGVCEDCFHCSDCFATEGGYTCMVYGWCSSNYRCWYT